nr:diguanylate cyclase [Scandinavium hiltneri]
MTTHQHEIVEIWTLATPVGELALRCRLTLATFPGLAPVILFEGANIPHAATENYARSASYRSGRHNFYQHFFMTTTAPMLLIDTARDGLIIDANLAALHFYGCRREEMCLKHTREINTLGRQVLPVMADIRGSATKLSGDGLPGFTVSIDVARYQAQETIDELFKRVDKALYQAKHDGRNRVLAA